MESFTSLLNTFKEVLMSVLPLSPFRQYIEYLAGVPYLSWINWFIPLGSVVQITATWLTAVTLHYTYQAILRWLHIIS